MSALGRRVLVVSHPSVLGVNQLPYLELERLGWRVDIVVPRTWSHEYGSDPIVPTRQPGLLGGYHPHRVALAGRPQRHAYLSSPAATLRRLRPDVVFLEQEPFSVAGLQWAWAAHRAEVPFGVQLAENLDRRLPRAVRAWRSWVLRHAAFVAARSDAAITLARRWGATGDVQLVPHHVPPWSSAPRSMGDRFRVGFAGRLVAEKGLDTLTEAVRQLDRPIELVVAGDGPLRGWLEAQDLGRARLRLLTEVSHDEMAAVYGAMDVLVLPSHTTPTWAEQFGRVLVEALWCGVPLVGSSSGEIPWVIERTGGGRVFPEGDPVALAGTLAALADDPAARVALAEAGRAEVERTFSVPAVGEAIDAILGGAIDRARGTSDDARPRVALVAHGIHDQGGMERACAELIRHAHRDFRFTVISCELGDDLRPLVDRWVRIRVPMRPIPLKFPAFFVVAGLAVRRASVDLVHTVGAIVPNRIDLATVHFCHAGHLRATGRLAPEGAPLLRRVNTGVVRVMALLAERWCYRPSRVRALAGVSAGVVGEVEVHYRGVPTQETPNGVDPVPSAHSQDHVSALRDAGGDDEDDRLVVLFVGGDWDGKGLALAIEGAAKAQADGTDVELWVVGPGDEPRFQGLADGLGIGGTVRFFGPQADVGPFYRSADVFLLPSAYETFSIVSFEAAAAGLPLVLPPLHGAGELLGDDGAGFRITRDASSIAAALATLAARPDVRRAMGAEAQRRVAPFTWERSAASVIALYRSLMAEGRG